MLKPSLNNNFDKKINLESYQSGKRVLNKTYYKARNRFLVIFAVFILILLFLPWTQNVTSYGNVTTLTPNNRPQTVVAPLEGRKKLVCHRGNIRVGGRYFTYIIRGKKRLSR